MAQFGNVVDVDTILDYGKHLVKIVDVRNKNQEDEIMLDEEGFELWNVTFQDVNNSKFYEYFRFSGKMANKTGYLLRACGVLEPDEKIKECKKIINPEDILGKYLYIEIVENPNATKEKYKKTIKFDGFEKYESPTKTAATTTATMTTTRKTTTGAIKKAEPKVEDVVIGGEDTDFIPF